MQKHKVIKSFWNNNVPIPIDFTEAKVAMDLLFVKKKKNAVSMKWTAIKQGMPVYLID